MEVNPVLLGIYERWHYHSAFMDLLMSSDGRNTPSPFLEASILITPAWSPNSVFVNQRDLNDIRKWGSA